MNETLKELARRRLAELGQQRGGGPLTLLAAWETLPVDKDGKRPISYETARRVAEQGHANIGPSTANALAIMFGVHVNDVLLAAGKRAELGRFNLPERADRLDRKERKAVLAVVDAILDAAEGKRSGDAAPAAQKNVNDPNGGGEVIEHDFRGPEVGEANAAQNETGPSVGQMKADQQDQDAEDESK